MNLIEQLGGYEKLKPHFVLTDREIGYTHVYLHGNNHYCFLDERVDYIIPDRAILIKDVFDVLLEYRHQHNIFEVGDKVVFLDEPIIRTITDVFTIKRVDFDSLTKGLILSSHDYDVFGYQNQMRHATDAEIKTGKRL